ncbi:DUF2859 domain-containing protein [Pseudoalteromonas luteoviolacea]|uniref:Integrating conjugative element protein n=1 Tax=Pseudoalteromonas luteoviolacea S4060-1 TaxID=1365257 RepID=A0A167KVY3_9GAMM|nr:DUF2859 domain-containing protein [Pseudoalteromonas luteoviolacea]KZN63374.1 hypothetical protein N478_03735 [Pseudoalteromonas luteoviolacea S4060-1]
MIVEILFASVVIADFGSTHSIQNYYNFEQSQSKPVKTATVESVKKELGNRFPFETNLAIGEVKTKELSEKFKYMNMAIVGDDPTSLNWLKRNFNRLRDSNAVIAVISVESQSRFDYIKDTVFKAGANVALLDSSFLNGEVVNYPAWILNGRVYQ